MRDLTTYSKKPKTSKKEKNEEVSKNNKRSIRFRIRLQTDKEAKEEMKEYFDDQNRAG
jgi:hypothetical protein